MSTPTALIRPRMEYYAWRHLSLEQFQGLDVLLALFDTLTRIPATVSEPYVARQKLAFFHEDILRIPAGTAQHPETQALATLFNTHPFDLSPWDNLCTAIDTDIDQVQSIDDNDLNRYCLRKRGSLLLMCAAWLKQAPLTDHEKNHIEQLGIFIERTQLLQIKNTYPEKQHLFPLKDFSLNEYIQKTREHFKKEPLTDTLKPIALLALLYQSLLDALEKKLPTQPDKQMMLNPMHILLLSLSYRIRGF